jgi:AraC-like DNA-binding protein
MLATPHVSRRPFLAGADQPRALLAGGPSSGEVLQQGAAIRRDRDDLKVLVGNYDPARVGGRPEARAAGHLSREFRLAYGESPYGYLMTRRIERAMAMLRRGDLSVTEACFAVGRSSLGTFSSGFTELVGVPPSTYRRHAARDSGAAVVRGEQVTKPDQESRSAGHRAATSLTAMEITSHGTLLPHDDPDASLAFYRDTLGFEVRNDIAYGGMRWITVGPADQPGTSISGLPVRL